MKDPLPPMLIVDDEKNMRSSLETVMHDEGYDVVAAESAEMALELVGEQPFFMKKGCSPTSSKAISADSAATTSYPSSCITVSSEERMFFSSSTMSIGGRGSFMTGFFGA